MKMDPYRGEGRCRTGHGYLGRDYDSPTAASPKQREQCLLDAPNASHVDSDHPLEVSFGHLDQRAPSQWLVGLVGWIVEGVRRAKAGGMSLG